MPSLNPFEHWPVPAASPEAPEPLKVEDWLWPRDTRWIVHAERKVLLEEMRAHLARLAPLMDERAGFLFFRTWIGDGDSLSVILSDDPRLATTGTTLISTNLVRSARYDEPNYPEGKTMELADLGVSQNSKWSDFAWETIFRWRSERRWDTPIFATLHQEKTSNVHLLGNIAANPVEPYPAQDLDEVATFSLRYQAAIEALRHCNEITLEENITGFSS